MSNDSPENVDLDALIAEFDADMEKLYVKEGQARSKLNEAFTEMDATLSVVGEEIEAPIEPEE